MTSKLVQPASRGGAALLSAITVIAVSACGSAGKAQLPGAANAAVGTGGGNSGHPGPAHFAVMRECLARNGVTLPRPLQGPGRPGAGGFLGSGEHHLGPPSGLNRQKLEAALKKCGAGKGHPRAELRVRLNHSPQARTAFIEFATCMRSHGINLPAPNLSGKGSIFDTTGLNTASASFRNAYAACRLDLKGAIPSSG